jgi:TPR repeat protein
MYQTKEQLVKKQEAMVLWESGDADDQELALDIMARVAREGDQGAMTMVAQWYYSIQDVDSALHFWKEAADLYDLGSMMNAAQVYAELEEMTQACEMWERAAQMGDTNAITKLASFLQSIQEGTPEIDSTCYEYTNKASEAGDVRSMKLLVEWKKPVVDEQSYQLYYKAAQHGDSEGYLQCGVMKYQGNGVSQNISMALELFIKAARMAAQPSITDIANMYQQGSTEMEPDYERAFELYTEASTQDPFAHKCIGDLFYSGLGCTKDIFSAMDHYQIAVERGCLEAMASLSICYVSIKPARRKEARELISTFILKSEIEGVKAKDLTREALDHILDSLLDQ